MTWAGQRKLLYMAIMLTVIAVLIGPFGYRYFFPKPTCFDGVQNQNEEGIDCGGACQKVCLNTTVSPRILWSRAFKVAEGTYSAVAYVSNPNFSLGAKDVPYTFKFYDERNILITERNGRATILPNTSFPVFEGIIMTGNRPPSRVFFEFTQTPNWQRLGNQPTISVKNKQLLAEDTSPRLSATLENSDISPVKNVSIVAVLYDQNDTAIAASQTLVEEIAAGGTKDIVFTWPAPFQNKVSRIEIYPAFLKIQ